MKVFIVFMALLIVNLNLVVFQDDHTVFEGIQSSVKSLADECAHGSAMMYDADAYGDGHIEYNVGEAVGYLEYMTDNYMTGRKSSMIRGISYTAYFFDDSGICSVVKDGSVSGTFSFSYPYTLTDQTGYSEVIKEPEVKVVVNAETDDVFRQNFIESRNIVRSSSYGNTQS